MMTSLASNSAYRVTDTAQLVHRTLSAHFMARDPHRSGAALVELADPRTSQDALDELLLVSGDTLRLIVRHPERRRLLLDTESLLNQLVVAQLIRASQRPLVTELLHRAAGLAAGLRTPGDANAFVGLTDHQVLVGAWGTTLGLIWTASRLTNEDQSKVYLRVLHAEG